MNLIDFLNQVFELKSVNQVLKYLGILAGIPAMATS
jgi:hypothetical protein